MVRRKLVPVIVFSILCTCSLVRAAAEDNSWFGPEWGVLQKVYDDCQNKDDIVGCLKGRALGALTKAVDQDSFSLIDGVSFVKQTNGTVSDKPELYDERALDELNPVDKSLFQKLDMFLRTHTLKFDLSEGRGKHHHKKKHEKKMSKYIVAALLTAMGIAGPIGLKALAAIAGKALVISKVALTIASIIALKKIFSSDHHEETSFQVHAGGHDNRRNTYLVRPVKPAIAAPSVDPYRYYYDPQYQASQLKYVTK